MPRNEVINVTVLIDDGPVTPLQIRAIALCSLVAFLDGLDTQSIAVAAPIIIDKLQLTRAALGPIFSSAVLAGAIGAFSFGLLGDRLGRKRVLAGAVTIFGVFTFLTAHAVSYETLLVMRFLAGLGLGGAVPCFIALATEYAPNRRRAMVASLIWAAYPLGGIIGGFLNSFVLAHFGWEFMFHVGGVLPLIVVVAMLIWLPESLRFLIASGKHPARVASIVMRMRPGRPAAGRYVVDEEALAGVPLKHLFTEGRAVATVLLWLPFFTAFGVLAITLFWTPVLLRDGGFAPNQAALVVGIEGIGALVGVACAGRLMERFGSFPVLIGALLLGAIATATIGYAAGSLVSITVVLTLVQLLIGVGASGSIALATLTYPTMIRSSGVGCAMGMGRFGQVLAPLAAAGAMTAGWSSQHLFLAFATAPVLGALAVYALRHQTLRSRAPVTP